VTSTGNALERLLWGSRFVVLVPVIGALVLAIGAFVLGAADTISVLGILANYLVSDTSSGHSTLRGDLIASMVKAIDADLIGAILLVVALGLYELFIDRLRIAEQSDVAERVLSIRTLDDLKDRISRLVLLILIVEFFGLVLGLSISSALELLMLGVGIFLVAGAIYLAGRH
jgi:uncharacterized membrane protein YqhA